MERDSRIDTIKAVAILMVLVLHMKPVWFAKAPPETASYYIGNAAGMFNAFVAGSAVPLFMLASLALFARRIMDMATNQASYLRRRIFRLGEVFLFWTALQGLIHAAIRWAGGLRPLVDMHGGPLRLILKGGPDLPQVGGSVFFFLLVLLELTIITYALIKLLPGGRSSAHSRTGPGAAICISSIICLIAYYEYLQASAPGAVGYWDTRAYLVYAPAAWLLVRTDMVIRMNSFLWAAYIAFVVYEFYKAIHLGIYPDGYHRGAVFFGAAAIFGAILKYGGLPAGSPGIALSKYSLGIYATHKYWWLLYDHLLSSIDFVKAHSTGYRLDYAMASALTALSLWVSLGLIGKTPIGKYIK